MIQVQLYGRCGNQLAQIATCLATAYRNGTNPMIPNRTVDPRTWKAYFPGLTPQRLVGRNVKVWRQPDFRYHPIPFEKNLILDGYFQSPKYFEDYLPEIRNVLKFSYTPIPDAISVHVRRGDYLTLQDKHPVVTLEYLNAAIDYFFKKGFSKFTFFSDDIPWCREHFRGDNYSFSHHRSEKEDMWLMACHAGHIIANSSFSWFASLLDPNPFKIVVAPKVWFGEGNAHLDTSDLLPENWIKL